MQAQTKMILEGFLKAAGEVPEINAVKKAFGDDFTLAIMAFVLKNDLPANFPNREALMIILTQIGNDSWISAQEKILAELAEV